MPVLLAVDNLASILLSLSTLLTLLRGVLSFRRDMFPKEKGDPNCQGLVHILTDSLCVCLEFPGGPGGEMTRESLANSCFAGNPTTSTNLSSFCVPMECSLLCEVLAVVMVVPPVILDEYVLFVNVLSGVTIS